MSDSSHQPKACSSCAAPILWAQLVDEKGEIVRHKDGEKKGRPKSIPVNFATDPNGNVVVWTRGTGFVARVLRRGEELPPGARPRTSHFATCPQAERFRRAKKAHPGMLRGGRR